MLREWSRRYRENGESGQSAIMMVLSLLVVFIVFALTFDAGVWFFDHREAQNQSEAAVLAGIQHMPVAIGDAAGEAQVTAAVDQWLDRNRSSSLERSCLQFEDRNEDGYNDTLRVCVRRQSPGFFSKLSGVDFTRVSAAATARVGAVDYTNVMPWAVIAPDPTCTEEAGRNCLYDAKGDGDYTDPGDCDAPFTVCPFGLTADRLYSFKAGQGGNTGIIQVCGGGANDYRDCLSGASSSGFYEIGDTVAVDTQPGQIANATNNGLQDRSPAGAWELPAAAVCDVDAYPYGPDTESPGYDPAGKAAAVVKFDEPETNVQCAYRLVPIVITTPLPQGSSDVQVLGFATFGVANWYRATGAGNTYAGTSSQACQDVGTGQLAANLYDCGTVWGHLFTGTTPPDALLQRIGDSNNPFAPLLIALVE